MRQVIPILAASALALAPVADAQQPAPSTPPARIMWYGILEDGLAEAKRSGRPILLVSGAPQCLGVSGIW